MLKHSKLLFLGTNLDQPYLLHLKGCIGTASCAVLLQTPTTFHELRQFCTAKGITGIISTSPAFLAKLLEAQWTNTRKKPSIDNYQGSLFTHPSLPETEIVFISPLEHLIKVSYGKFMASRYISKLTDPNTFFPEVKFNWSIYDGSSDPVTRFSKAVAVATDIETFPNPPSIRCVGYTALFANGNDWTSESIVIPCDSEFNLAVIRQLNNLPVAKIFQNGKYDLSYLQAYNSAPVNYLWDTAEMMHSWYSELPKDLASLNAFFVRKAMYWKDLAETQDLHEYYKYNALDTHATAMVFLTWMRDAPKWAKNNYINTFPLQFPCHLSEMTGLLLDKEEQKRAATKQQEIVSRLSASLDKMLGVKGFNVASPIQVRQALVILGCGDLESADEKNLSKAKLRHPLNARIIDSILEVRKARKLISTYLTEGKEFNGHFGNRQGRILYSLNPHGTDTGRLASKEHHFWCGLQIQNIPRGDLVKRTLIADDGFVIAECDLEQAESRDTAHIAGSESLIAAVSGDKDFHSVNASAFFGVPYDSIYDDGAGKTKDKKLRDLAKRVNHGANYNMGANVLVETMGLDKIWEAQKILKLPKLWTPKQVAEHLLSVFHATYPDISKTYYPGVIHEIQTTKMLTSKATHAVPYQASSQGLVRYCFGDPKKNKSDLNAYVAHPPQSLNAMTLNRAFMKVFYEIALTNVGDFKLLAQIHDSILFMFKRSRTDLARRVKEAMEIPVTVRGYDGKTRTFTVPAALKCGSDGNGADNWGETE
jgi:DNA polymerase I-like protein with 3'-5' exonuclease and polymerase domains